MREGFRRWCSQGRLSKGGEARSLLEGHVAPEEGGIVKASGKRVLPLGLGFPLGGRAAIGSQSQVLWVGDHCPSPRERGEQQELLERRQGVPLGRREERGSKVRAERTEGTVMAGTDPERWQEGHQMSEQRQGRARGFISLPGASPAEPKGPFTRSSQIRRGDKIHSWGSPWAVVKGMATYKFIEGETMMAEVGA